MSFWSPCEEQLSGLLVGDLKFSLCLEKNYEPAGLPAVSSFPHSHWLHFLQSSLESAISSPEIQSSPIQMGKRYPFSLFLKNIVFRKINLLKQFLILPELKCSLGTTNKSDLVTENHDLIS